MSVARGRLALCSSAAPARLEGWTGTAAGETAPRASWCSRTRGRVAFYSWLTSISYSHTTTWTNQCAASSARPASRAWTTPASSTSRAVPQFPPRTDGVPSSPESSDGGLSCAGMRTPIQDRRASTGWPGRRSVKTRPSRSCTAPGWLHSAYRHPLTTAAPDGEPVAYATSPFLLTPAADPSSTVTGGFSPAETHLGSCELSNSSPNDDTLELRHPRAIHTRTASYSRAGQVPTSAYVLA